MYETFVKQFIDIMDERAPVTLVRSRIEMPLGSVQAEQSTLIHTRLDLLDDDSPYADIVISGANHTYRMVYSAHIPAEDQMTDEQFVQKVREIGTVGSISVVQPIDGGNQSTYVVTGQMGIDLQNDDQNTNSSAHDLSEIIAGILHAGGYESMFENNLEPDDRIVTWSLE